MIRWLVVILMLFPAVAYGADHHVDTGASGGNDGSSWTDAWESVGDITWGSVDPGDTVYFSGGSTSKSYGYFNISKSGTNGSPITFRAGQDGGHNGTVVFSGIDTNNYDYVTINGEYNGLKHIRVSGGGGIGVYTSTGADVGVILTYMIIRDNGSASGNHGVAFRGYVTDCELSYSEIYNNYQDGVNVYYGGSTGDYGALKVHHNTIYSNGDDGIQTGAEISIYNNTIYGHNQWDRGHPDNIQQSGGANHTKIYNNIIYGAGNWNIAVDPNSNSSNIWIYNNLVYGDATYEPLADTKGILVYADKDGIDISSVKVMNNTVVDARYSYGLGFFSRNDSGASDLDDVIVTNNLLYSTRSIVTESDWGTVTNYSVDYNVVYDDGNGNSTDTINWNGTPYTCSGGSYSGMNENGSCENEPLFVDAGNRDYNLASNDTAALGQGVDLSEYFTDDIEGNTRSAWSIGAYESSVAGCSPDTSPPTVSNVLVDGSAAPEITTNDTTATLTAYASDSASCASTIDAAEYFIASEGTAGAGTAMTATDSSFDEVAEDVTVSINVSAWTTTGSPYVLYVDAQDSATNWGPTAAESISVTVNAPPDGVAPADVSGFSAVASTEQNTLTWGNPGDEDFAGTLIMYSISSYPLYYTSGTQAYTGTAETYDHTGLSDGVNYYYTAFTFDAAPNYSGGVNTAASPPSGVISDYSFKGSTFKGVSMK